MTSLRNFIVIARQLVLTFGIFAGLSVGNVATAEEQFIPSDLRACTAEDISGGYDVLCKEPLPTKHIARELEKLKTTNFAYAIQGTPLSSLSE